MKHVYFQNLQIKFWKKCAVIVFLMYTSRTISFRRVERTRSDIQVKYKKWSFIVSCFGVKTSMFEFHKECYFAWLFFLCDIVGN
jgi:hypothetical protein